MYHIFFIHSSVNGPLSCLHVITIVNSAMNTMVHVFFQITVFSKHMPRSEITGENPVERWKVLLERTLSFLHFLSFAYLSRVKQALRVQMLSDGLVVKELAV